MQCTRNGRYYEDGKWWCKTHAPSNDGNHVVIRITAQEIENWKLKEALLEAQLVLVRQKLELVEILKVSNTTFGLSE